jgi:hypothetical protein
MRPTNKMHKTAFLLIFLVAISLANSACTCGLPLEPGLTVRVHNQADKTLKIYDNRGGYVGDIAPQGELTYYRFAFPPYKVTAKDAEGNVVYSASFTQKDLTKVGGVGYEYDVYIPPKQG